MNERADRTPTLQERMRTLDDSSLHPSDKLDIAYLMLVPQKRGTLLQRSVGVGDSPPSEAQRETFEKEWSVLQKTLDEMRVPYLIDRPLCVQDGMYQYRIVAAKKRADLDAIQKLANSEETEAVAKELGRYMGYPETAIAAYRTPDTLHIRSDPKQEQRVSLKAEGIFPFVTFAFSRSHFGEELDTVRLWKRRVEAHCPKLYQELLRAGQNYEEPLVGSGSSDLETGVEQRTNPDKERWLQGARNFKRFLQLYKQFTPALVRGKFGFFSNRSRSNKELEMLAWVLMGERPAFKETAGAPRQKTREILGKFGLKVTSGILGGWYVYNPVLVQAVIAQNRGTFERFGSVDADEVMNKLAHTQMHRDARVRGLVLGYPKEAVEAYEAANPRGVVRSVADGQIWSSSVPGFGWVHESANVEASKGREEKLKEIWELTNIGGVINDA